MREQETALLAGGVSSRCCGAVGLGADEAPSSRSNARFSFVIFLFVFFFCFFFCNSGDAAPKAGLTLLSTATLQRLHQEVQNPFKSIAIKAPMVLLFSFLLLFL